MQLLLVLKPACPSCNAPSLSKHCTNLLLRILQNTFPIYNTKQGNTPVVSRVLPVPFLKYINNKALSPLPGDNLLLPYNWK